jgi:putative ABC transport system permease protein
MFRNYFKTAWRNLLKNKFYSLINMAGLTAGLAIGILILLWVEDERNFDSFHKNAADIYRMELFGGTGTSKQIWSMTVAPMGPLAKADLPEVVEQARITDNNFASLYKYQDKSFADEHAMFADPSFFGIFGFPLVEGSTTSPFPDAHSVVITSRTAKKFFGNEPALGKVISTENNENYKVSGVINDVPLNSSLQFDMLMPIEGMFQRWMENKIDLNHDFNSYMFLTFLQVKHGASTAGLPERLNKIHLRNRPEDTDADYLLLPLTKMHLYNADGSDAGAQTVTIFTVIALLILGIACINYVNLSTARAMLRGKEVSMRKIVGAAKGQLFLQFVVETALLFVLSAVLAVMAVKLAMPLFNQLAGKQLIFDISNGRMWMVVGCTIAATLVASSIYPAMLLSSFDPLKALKSKLSISRGDAAFRKVLVVIQFASSVILIIGTLVIYRQLSYIRHKDLGYDKSHVFSFWMRNMRPSYETAKGELSGLTGVQGVTASTNSIINLGGISGDNDWDGKGANQTFIVHPIAVDKDFLSFFKMQLAEGQGFTDTKADSAHFLLNETAVKEIGLQHPIGKRFRLGKTNGTIVGVVKDFHFGSMKQKIAPVVFLSANRNLSRMYIRTRGENAAATILAAGALFKKYNADYPFSYTFLDESFNQLYQSEEREGGLFFYFAAIAIMISCLGLFALAAYATHLRFREIGIRKVLGASVPSIIGLLAKDFVRLVLLGIVIAVPVAGFAMDSWLGGFAYRTDLGWMVFVAAGLITIVIALMTISFQAVKAAVANPVNSLKTE